MATAKVNTSAKLIAQVMAIAALALSVQPASAQTMYRVVRMALTGSTPIAINSKGKILLWSSNGSYYVCSETSCRILPRVQDGTTHWEDFNDLGMLAGTGVKPGVGQQAIRKDPAHGGGAKFLTTGFGMAIAPDGAVVGRTQDYKAFLFTDHRIPLEGLAGPFPEPLDINSSHQIVGRSRGADNRDHATLWVDGGPAQDLGMAPGHGGSGARAINEAGVAVGYSSHPTFQNQPARFANGSVQVFEMPIAGTYGGAVGINSAGTIIGYYRDVDTRAGIVEGDRMIDLNTRLRPEDALVYNLWTADAINENGQIAATHVDPVTHFPRVVRLDPIN